MKKYISIFLSFAIALMSLPLLASAEGEQLTGTLSIGEYSAESGETIDVEVILSDNPGIIALSFDVEYDSERLELIKAEDGKILGTSTSLFGNDTTANPYRLCWDDLSTENNTGNGTVATLTFKVKEDAPSGIASVGLILNQGSTFNVDMEDVAFTTESGVINVTGNQAQETTTTQITDITTTTTVTTDNDTTESPKLSIKSTSAESGETIDVEVILSDNPGIIALSFDVEYDSERLELIKAEDGKILGTSTSLFGNDTTANPYRLCWDDLSTENNTGNGTVATLTFKVKEDAPSGIASVGLILNQGSTFNVDMEDVAFTTESGVINVTGNQAQETTTTQITDITTTTTVTTDNGTTESPKLSIKSTSAKSGETIDVEVIISDNPGILSLGFLVEYDAERLELVKAENGNVFDDSSAIFDNDINTYPYYLNWYNFSTENSSENGTIATLTFKVKKDAPLGNAYIDIIMDETNTYNTDLEDVIFETESVGINVIPNKQTTTTRKPAAPSTHTSTTTTKPAAKPATTTTSPDTPATVNLGDVNTDGSVDALDASMVLSDYAMKATGHESIFNAEQSKAADLNSDGAVDALDASLILSYYAYKATGGNQSITEYLK